MLLKLSNNDKLFPTGIREYELMHISVNYPTKRKSIAVTSFYII